MEQENKVSLEKNSNSANKLKWVTLIVYWLIFPPLGAYYLWKEMQYFSKKLDLFLIFFGIWNLVIFFIILTMWLPSVSESLGEIIEVDFFYHYIVLSVGIILSIIQIALGFIVHKKITSSQILSKNTKLLAISLLLINLILIPIMLISIQSLVLTSLYQEMVEI